MKRNASNAIEIGKLKEELLGLRQELERMEEWEDKKGREKSEREDALEVEVGRWKSEGLRMGREVELAREELAYFKREVGCCNEEKMRLSREVKEMEGRCRQMGEEVNWLRADKVKNEEKLRGLTRNVESLTL